MVFFSLLPYTTIFDAIARLRTEICGLWHNPPRSLAGGCSSAFAQLDHFP